MKKQRLSEEQIIGVLREQEAGAKAADLCRKHGISEATFYNWKAKYGGMELSEAKRLKALEHENAKLKKLLAEQMLDKAALRELLAKKIVGPAAERDAVAHLKAIMGVSERRACQNISADRNTIRYRSSRPPEVELRTKLRDLANERRRFGYRRLFILLRRDGEPSGVNRIYRLHREEGLSVRKRKARRRAVGTHAPILVEAKANARWSLDFVHDQFVCGRRFRILNVVDDVTRECLAAITDTSISGRRNDSLFFGLDHARSAVAEWVNDDNNFRPHSSLGYQTPADYAGSIAATGPNATRFRRWLTPHHLAYQKLPRL